jgi:hypothetical protein
VERGDLDQEQSDHPTDQGLECGVDVVGEDPHRLGPPVPRVDPAGGPRRAPDAHPVKHSGGLVGGDRVVEGDVPGHEPHAVVAGHIGETRLVTGVRLEEPPVDVGDRRAGDVLLEASPEVGDRQEAEHPAEALDRPDPGQGADGRLRRAVADEEPGLLHVGEVLGPGVERHVEDRRGELLPPLLLPGVDGRPPVPRPGRDVLPLGVEAAVTPHAVGDEGLDDVVVGQQFRLAELGLCSGHRTPACLPPWPGRCDVVRPVPAGSCAGPDECR